jgi:hypothetical protein
MGKPPGGAVQLEGAHCFGLPGQYPQERFPTSTSAALLGCTGSPAIWRSYVAGSWLRTGESPQQRQRFIDNQISVLLLRARTKDFGPLLGRSLFFCR